MSIWTNVLGVIRFSDEKLIDLSKVFIAEDFYYKPIRGCNMPYGTEGSIQWYAQKEKVMRLVLCLMTPVLLKSSH